MQPNIGGGGATNLRRDVQPNLGRGCATYCWMGCANPTDVHPNSGGGMCNLREGLHHEIQ